MVFRIGFVVNPIAGMGGKVGLKGTDGVYDEAVLRGAKPVAFDRAVLCFKAFHALPSSQKDIKWLTCSEDMGQKVLDETDIPNYKVVYDSKKKKSQADDTIAACEEFVRQKVDLIVFCGGDGTARDVVSVVDKKTPILGIPSGVKMHSAVFGINPEAAAKMLHEFVHDHLRIGDAEIMDLDEDLYRKGVWKVRLYASAKGLVEPTYIQVGKQMFDEVSENAVRDELVEHILDEMNESKDTLFLFGSGGTIDYIAENIGFENTVLGIDAVCDKKTIRKDVNEKDLLELLKKYNNVKLIISPIGAQGFILGRGNLQLSPKVLRIIGIDNIIVISTPSKLLSTPLLRVDTGDKDLDNLFRNHEMMMVVIGYRLRRVVRIQKQ